MSSSNIINKLSFDIKNLRKCFRKFENRIDNLDKHNSIQLISDKYTKLELLSDNIDYIYGMNDNDKIFDIDIDTKSCNIIFINTSVSFIVESSELEMGSVILRLKINDTLIGENEVMLSNKGFNNISLSHTQPIENNSTYSIEVLYEGNILTNNVLIENPSLNTKSNGAYLSIMTI